MKEAENERLLKMLEKEKELYTKGYTAVAGVDEAGRGPLAGDVYAAAVILPADAMIEGLNDSKKLSPKKREKLFDEIKKTALAWAVGTASVYEIDEINILNATFLAMRRAISGLTVCPDYVIVDGNQQIRELDIKNEPLIKGDSLSQSIAAASVLAKVSRDRYMMEMAEKYPNYAFGEHKGYGTAKHIALIRENGPCEIHRMSFLGNILK